MRLRRLSSTAWELQDIHPLFAGLLAELPRTASRHKKSHARLYPDPLPRGSRDPLRRDWRELVHPELQQLFAGSREIVQRDLDPLGANSQGTSLSIPTANFDAWLNALNQARLILVDENHFTEQDLEQREPPDLATRRGVALLKVHFYAHLQELLLEASS